MLEALAAVVLLGLMLIPVVNVGVGAVAGYALYGVGGALAGHCAGFFITTFYKPY